LLNLRVGSCPWKYAAALVPGGMYVLASSHVPSRGSAAVQN
jgi:hypothetical protein